ncbi:MAG: cation:proton antiporter regulatory subunit [Firmicutes bacterium]|nr:cation:proton antiporter regulatory subunit [Bacillota bacterium]
MTTYREVELPGIGRKFQIETRAGDRLVIVVHDDGRREIYYVNCENPEECGPVVTLDDAEARQVAAILGGMAYTPKALESVEMAFDEMVFEWFRVEPEAEAAGKTIGQLQVRKRTGATIIAVVGRDRRKIVNPGPDQVIQEGATLVVMGERRQVRAFRELILRGGR